MSMFLGFLVYKDGVNISNCHAVVTKSKWDNTVRKIRSHDTFRKVPDT